MEPYVHEAAHSRVFEGRLAEFEHDLGIVGYQRAAWEVFLESFASLLQTLEDADTECVIRVAGGNPRSLAGGLHEQMHRLSTLLQAMQILAASIENLYRSLTARQRERADRLLAPLCGELELMI